jgi:nucleoside-diphosphate-sugar epimerase
MRILIIGGTGFIGLPLVRRLIELGQEVTVFHRGKTETELPKGVKQIHGDRQRLSDHAKDFRQIKPEIVVDTIAFTEQDAKELISVSRGIAQRSVLISSADVYRAYSVFIGVEEGPVEVTPLTEESPLRTVQFPYRTHAEGPEDFRYGYDKIPVEETVLGKPELPGTVLRLPMVYGIGDPFHRLGAYVKRMVDGRPVILLAEAMARWKCTRGNVENVAAAVALAVLDPRAAGRVFNVAEAIADTEAEWVARIGQVVGWKGRVVQVPHGRIAAPYHWEQSIDTDSGRIRRELGYEEPVTRDEALRRTIAWERNHPTQQGVGIGLLDQAAEDALLAELKRCQGC